MISTCVESSILRSQFCVGIVRRKSFYHAEVFKFNAVVECEIGRDFPIRVLARGSVGHAIVQVAFGPILTYDIRAVGADVRRQTMTCVDVLSGLNGSSWHLGRSWVQ